MLHFCFQFVILICNFEFTFRNQSSTAMYDQLSQATNINVEPCNMGGCQMSNQRDDGLPSWHHSYTATELLSTFMPPNSFHSTKVLILITILII